jgi:chaperonin GroEL
VGNYGKKTETGLIKYLTGSEKLGNDLVELMRSLGMSAKIEKAGELYSVSQVENNTLGTAIIGVEKTGVLTEMMCIKVSNPDNLYITNDYVVTHNTSTTSILIKELCLRGRKAVQTGSNVNEVKSGMLKAGKWMNEYIKKSATPINGDFDLIGKVATISANNDPEVGNLVVQGMKKVGMDGLLTADLAIGLDTQIDITSGMKLGKGWSSPQYVTDPATGECIMENPYILVAGEKLSSVNQIVPLMNALINSGTGRPILIVCDSIDDVVNTTLVLNVLRGAVRCCVVQGIDFGDNRKNTMNDLAVATGGAYICQENGLTESGIELDNLGGASKVVVNKDSCVIYEGFGDPDEVTKLADLVKTRMKDPQLSDYEKTKFEKRLANLTGGIAIIKAGGATESEKMNRKATIEDSILAAKSAIEEGFVPGGGYVYLKGSELVEKDKAFWKSLSGDEVDGAKIVFSSLPIVMKTIAENSGKSGDVVLEEASHKKKDNIGYNAKTKKFGDLLEDGILDSTKVIRVALENSISTASMILLIDCTIIDEEDNKE